MPPDAWNASDRHRRRLTRHLEQAERVALQRPHPAQRRPARCPLEQRRSTLGVDDGQRAVGRACEAGSCHLGGEIAVGAGDDGAGGESRPVGRGEPTRIGSSQRLEDHHLGEQPCGDAAKCLRQIESAERKAVEHGEHRRRPPPGGLVLPDVGRQLAATEPFGRRPELFQLGRELEATHAAHPTGGSTRASPDPPDDSLPSPGS